MQDHKYQAQQAICGRWDCIVQATNSWILDYMIHGQRKYLWEEILQLPHEESPKFPFQSYHQPVLAQDNGLNATRAWKLIDEFVQTLKKASDL